MPPQLPESTLHDVEARCPQCGDTRVLSIYAPASKLTMDRLCDHCQGLPPLRAATRKVSLPHPDD